MVRTGLVLLVTALFVVVPTAVADNIGYDILITTAYAKSNPFVSSTFLGRVTHYFDTGFVQIWNQGTTTFSGGLGAVAITSAGRDLSLSVENFTLAPGAAVSINVSSDSSGVRGFNGPYGTRQPGVEVFLTGFFNGTEAVNLSVFDRDIHSGVFRISPCDGILSDSYVMQGGSPTGCDNKDGWELHQAQGNYRFFQQAGVPEPSSLLLLGSGVVGALSIIRRKVVE
jgi:hypothetical protein